MLTCLAKITYITHVDETIAGCVSGGPLVVRRTYDAAALDQVIGFVRAAPGEARRGRGPRVPVQFALRTALYWALHLAGRGLRIGDP